MARPKVIETIENRRKLAQHWKNTLIQRASETRQKAVSYRGFTVGCAMLGVNRQGKFRPATGANFKPFEGSHKLCAEMGALQSAFKHRSPGGLWIVAAAIVGEPMEDSQSKLRSDTLHPCKQCRDLFVGLTKIQANPEDPTDGVVMEEDALFFTSVPGSRRVVEPIEDENTLHELLDFHGHEHECAYHPGTRRPKR